MLLIKFLFFFGLAVLFYSYFGYGILLYILVKFRGASKAPAATAENLQPVTLVVAAFNEEGYIKEKIKNSLQLDYPADLLKIIFISDGSGDATESIIKEYPQIRSLHEPERKGKIAAMHRAMSYVTTPIVVYSDANTLLNAKSIQNIVRHYSNPAVGGVAGEKKVLKDDTANAASAGEGLYWKYESFLKKLDWQFYSVVGAAGELFSLRTDLYEYPGNNVLLDDFILSLRVCMKGYRVAYEPEAFALETGSASIKEEQKRKIRISAGGFQSIAMLKPLLNIFKYPRLSFQYISHRVLRWTLCPLFLPITFILNAVLVALNQGWFYNLVFVAQVFFYGCALAGWILTKLDKKVSALYAAYYFLFINYSLYLGFIRYLKGNQSVIWDKAKRS